MRNLIFRNFSLKILSLLFAVSLWLFANLKATADRSMKIPVVLDNLSSNLIITNTITDHINVKVDGPWRIISNLDPNEFPIHLDLSDAKAGVNTYQINEKMMQLPSGLKLTILFPDTIQIRLETLVPKDVLVKANIRDGSLEQGYAIQEVQVTPKYAGLIGAKSEIAGLSVVETEEIDLAGRKDTFETEVNIIPREPHIWATERYRKVKVRITIIERTLQKEFLKQPVSLKNAPGHVIVKPAYVDVVIEGPATKLDKVTPHMVRPEVTVPKGTISSSKLPVIVELPEEGVRAHCRPERVLVTILNKENSH